MKKHLRKATLSLLSACLLCLSWIPLQAQGNNPSKSIEYDVPCLTVKGNEHLQGKLSYLPMKITRTDSDAPLKIMMVDDTPNGSGEDIRSSVWMAAATAALLRNDSMRGVTISVEFTGSIGGPSAGGVTCLAILSALDGLEFPTDFAMTGTILPDGTIGMVGGVPAKLRAAVAAGKKRIFVPAYQRIYEEMEGEQTIEVDLQALGDELGVELFFVDNIKEAYCILHDKPAPHNGYQNVKQITRLPKESEAVVTKWYNIYRDRVREYIQQSGSEDIDITLMNGYSFSPAAAEGLYREGKLLPAVIQMYNCLRCWRAGENAYQFLEQTESMLDLNAIGPYLQEFQLRKLLPVKQEAMEEFLQALATEQSAIHDAYSQEHFAHALDSQKHGYFPNSPTLTEFTAQLEPIVLQGMLQAEAQEKLGSRIPPEQLQKATRNNLLSAWTLEDDLVAFCALAAQNDCEFTDFLIELGESMPKLHANDQARDVERLFWAAAQSIDAVAREEFQRSMECRQAAQDAPSDGPEYLPFVEQYNVLLNQALNCHDDLDNAEENPLFDENYHLQATLKHDIAFFATASLFNIFYSSSTADSSDFLPQLLRNARETALANIAECVKAGIPCMCPIYDFESAEAQASQGRGAALEAYWRASLYAKALLMSFQK